MVGAHYDHIGHGEIDSLAHKGEEGQVHNGADDNASGVSTVLELAASLAKAREGKSSKLPARDYFRSLVWRRDGDNRVIIFCKTFYHFP